MRQPRRVRFWLGPPRLLQCVRQHLFPACCIVQGYTHGVLHKSRNICRFPSRYQSANFLNLILVKSDGDLLGRHTKYHATEPALFSRAPWKRKDLPDFFPPSNVYTYERPFQ